MKSLMLVLIAVLTVGVMAGVATAQEPPLSYTGTIEEDFDSIGPSGTEMPAGWIAGFFGVEEQEIPGGAINDAPMNVNDGTVEDKGDPLNVGKTGDTDRAVGLEPTSSAGDGAIQLALRNDTGMPLSAISITYTGEQWRDGQASSGQEILNPDGSTNLTERLVMFISDADDFSGNVERLPVEFDFNRLQNTSGSDFGIDGSLPENRTENIGGEYTFATPIAPGDIFYITWFDFESDGTNDHLLCIDDILIGQSNSLAPIYPENGGWVVFDAPEVELQWQRYDPNGPDLPPAALPVDVYFGRNNPLLPGDRVLTAQDVDSYIVLDNPLVDGTTYYWRIDAIDPNEGGNPAVITGPTWSFDTVVPAEILVDKAEVQVSEEGPTSDTYTITLSKVPAQPVTVTVGPTFEPIPILDIGCTASSDDSEEHLDGAIESLTSSDLELGWEDNSADQQLIGLRFNNVNIPMGATITSAYMQFNEDEANSGECNLNIAGQLSPDVPSGFTSTAYDISSRPRTIAEVAWTDVEAWSGDNDYQTPDITSIISEITAQGGWMYGNSLVLFVEPDADLGCPDKRVAESSSHADKHPLLHIEWTVGTGTPNWQVSWTPSVVLDDTNWELGEDVTVTAVDDTFLEIDPHLFTLPNVASSADADWNALPVDDVVVSILENECGAWLFAAYDFNTDCVINIKDLAMFAEEFGTCTDPKNPSVCGDAR